MYTSYHLCPDWPSVQTASLSCCLRSQVHSSFLTSWKISQQQIRYAKEQSYATDRLLKKFWHTHTHTHTHTPGNGILPSRPAVCQDAVAHCHMCHNSCVWLDTGLGRQLLQFKLPQGRLGFSLTHTSRLCHKGRNKIFSFPKSVTQCADLTSDYSICTAFPENDTVSFWMPINMSHRLLCQPGSQEVLLFDHYTCTLDIHDNI